MGKTLSFRELKGEENVTGRQLALSIRFEAKRKKAKEKKKREKAARRKNR
jgi:hypothetical protein